MLYIYSILFAIICVCTKGDNDSSVSLRGVSMHRAQMNFANVLATAMQTDDFQQQVSKTVPMMCDGSEDPEKCKESVTKSLMCTSFLDKAVSLAQDDVKGAANFVKRCKSIERQVPNLSNVFNWVQNPEQLFNAAVQKGEVDTGVTLSGLSGTTASGLGEPNQDAKLGLSPLGGSGSDM